MKPYTPCLTPHTLLLTGKRAKGEAARAEAAERKAEVSTTDASAERARADAAFAKLEAVQVLPRMLKPQPCTLKH